MQIFVCEHSAEGDGYRLDLQSTTTSKVMHIFVCELSSEGDGDKYGVDPKPPVCPNARCVSAITIHLPRDIYIYMCVCVCVCVTQRWASPLPQVHWGITSHLTGPG